MKYERLKAEEKARIVEAVRASHLPVAKALRLLEIPRSTYYNWLRAANREKEGMATRKAWNRLLA